MNWDTIVPVVAVVIGGVLTTLGSLVMHRMTHRVERREFKREKLEEMYRLSSQLVEWARDQVGMAAILGLAMTGDAAASLEALKQGSHPARTTDDLVMIARFYHSSLEADARALDAEADALVAAVSSFESHLATRPNPLREVESGLLDPATRERDYLEERVEHFQRTLAREAGKYA